MNRFPLPDATPTTAATPLEVFMPIPVMIDVLNGSIACIQTLRGKFDEDDGNVAHTDALIRQREQLRERIRVLEALGDDQVYMAMYPKSPYGTSSREEIDGLVDQINAADHIRLEFDADGFRCEFLDEDDEDDPPLG